MAQNLCDETLRPGGLALTQKALALCRLAPGARVLDAGCGAGATVRLLRGMGYDAIGVDIAPHGAKDDDTLLRADAAHLPFANGEMDAVLFECSLSKIQASDAALREAARVLKPGGPLLLADLYAKGTPCVCNGLLGRLESWEALQARAATCGFVMQHFEDCPDALASYYGQLVFQHGAGALPGVLGGAEDALKQAQAGYFWAVFHKEEAAKAPPPATVHAVLEESPLRRWVGQLTRLGPAPTPEELLAWQLEKAFAMAQRAREASPFYAQHLPALPQGMAPTLQNWHALPFCTAQDLAREGARMLCTGLGGVARVRTLPTSGSMGPAKRVWFTEGDMARTVDFFRVGMQQIAPKGGSVAIFMSDERPGSIADLLQKGLAQNGVKAVVCGGVQSADEARRKAGGAACYVGLPAEMLYLCRTAPTLCPATVLLSADYISPAVEKALCEAWGCRVYTHYGLTESCYGLAVQCAAAGGQHLRAAHFLVEVIDPATGAALPAGHQGELVLTSLAAEALPLVRYRTGDIASLIAVPCACGCTLPRLAPVRGRAQNLARRPNIHQLDDVLYAIPGLAAYGAAWDGRVLHLVLEGTRPGPEELEALCGCPVKVRYGAAYGTGGKRGLEYTGA